MSGFLADRHTLPSEVKIALFVEDRRGFDE